MRQRVTLLKEFQKFLISENSYNYDAIFDINILLPFVIDCPYISDKRKIITHLSMSLTHIQFKNSVLHQPIEIKLHSRPEFISLFFNKPKVLTSSDKKFLTPDEIILLVQAHDKNPNRHLCRAFFQLVVSCRIENTFFSLNRPHKFKLSKHSTQKIHSHFVSCQALNNPESIDCFNYMTSKSKTSDSATFPVHPCVYSCYNNINSVLPHTENWELRLYNKFLSCFFNRTVNSHHIRKTLSNFCPSLTDSSRNLGLWRSASTMRKHYISDTSLISDLFQFVQKNRVNSFFDCSSSFSS